MIAVNVSSAITYLWYCYIPIANVNTPCAYTNGSLVGTFSNSDLSFPPFSFLPFTNMIWGLTISTDDYRTSIAEVLVGIYSAKAPSMILIGPSGLVQQNSIITVSIKELSYPMSNCTFRWQITGSLTSSNIITKIDGDYIKINVTNPISNSTRQFTVTSTVTEFNLGISSQASITFTIDVLPIPGKLIVSPNSGIAWYTNFSLQADDFTLPTGNIYYEFGIIKPGTDRFIPFGIKRIVSIVTVQLPSGFLQISNYAVKLVVRAYNKNGGYVEVNTTAKILPYLFLFVNISKI